MPARLVDLISNPEMTAPSAERRMVLAAEPPSIWGYPMPIIERGLVIFRLSLYAPL